MKKAKGRISYFICQKRMYLFLLLTFFLSLAAFGDAQAQALPETSKLIPPETVLLVNVDNFSQLKAQFEKTTFYKLYKDPAMRAFVEDSKSKVREEIRKANSEVIGTIIDADVLPQGRVAFVLVLNERAMDAKEPMALFITQWGENCSKIEEAVEKQVKKAVEDGAHQKSEDYRGVNIKTIIGDDSSRLGFGFSSKLSYCFVGDNLVGSEDVEVLKFVIAHIKGASSPTLADDADYTAAKGATGPYHDIDFYVNIKHIIKMILAEDTTGKRKTAIANLGFDNVRFLAWSLGIGRLPGISCGGKALLKIQGAKKGICRMLETESAVLRPPRFIPTSACSATFFNLNIRKAYDELVNILKSFSPQAAAIMFMPLLPPSPDGEPGLEIKRDIINHLGSQVVVAQSMKKSVSVALPSREMFLALTVGNRKALEKSLSLLHSKMMAPNNPDARRELLGHTIYLVSLPGCQFFGPGATPMQSPAEATVPQGPTLAFTITDTHLIFGVESTVERAIRALSSTGASSMGSAKWFTLCQSAIPSVVGLASLQDNAASGEFSWRIMKESSKSESKNGQSSISIGFGMSSSLGLIFSQTGLNLFNFGLLPEFDVVRKYFGVSASYGVSRLDGFFFEFKYLNPSGTD
jgi:hypothetical protein